MFLSPSSPSLSPIPLFCDSSLSAIFFFFLHPLTYRSHSFIASFFLSLTHSIFIHSSLFIFVIPPSPLSLSQKLFCRLLSFTHSSWSLFDHQGSKHPCHPCCQAGYMGAGTNGSAHGHLVHQHLCYLPCVRYLQTTWMSRNMLGQMVDGWAQHPNHTPRSLLAFSRGLQIQLHIKGRLTVRIIRWWRMLGFIMVRSHLVYLKILTRCDRGKPRVWRESHRKSQLVRADRDDMIAGQWYNNQRWSRQGILFYTFTQKH